MASKSRIEWTDVTWNPVTGCTPISEGCENCWARAFAKRFGFPQKVTLRPERLEDPSHWRKVRRVFVCSMSDLFHKDIPFWFVSKVFDTMLECPQHIFQILTKRPERMNEYVWDADVTGDYTIDEGNVWYGVSIENQERADERIPLLLQIPAAVRFISFEPLLGSIDDLLLISCREDDTDLEEFGQHIDWVIIGCESINGRPGRFADGFVDAAIDLVRQCKEAGVPVFVKQVPVGKRVSHNPAEWPEELRVQEYPEQKGGSNAALTEKHKTSQGGPLKQQKKLNSRDSNRLPRLVTKGSEGPGGPLF